jgi:hypothetical protein
MIEHGLPILVTRDDWRLRGWNLTPILAGSRLYFPDQFSLLERLPAREFLPPRVSGVKLVADQMLAALEPNILSRRHASLERQDLILAGNA